LSSATTVERIFNDCWSLTDVADLDISSATNISYMFYECRSMTHSPNLTVTPAGLTTAYRMFRGCSNMIRVSVFDTSHITTINNFFESCEKLQEIPAFDFSSASNLSYCGQYINNLKKYSVVGISVNISLQNCCLSATELNEVYSNLENASATITVTGNPGITSDNPSIATAKGWTVTG